ncbi:MAG: threonylcarbamoyl-AMP synthase [Phototrophicales bacterium]|nr:MAG: threonylcarbamoyl-AMP synthase [Phototrophicales bacterium]
MTIMLSADDPNAFVVAAEMLNRGQIVAIPTDTGYGLAASLADEAILRLYLAKERPPDKSTPILIADLEDIETVAQPLLPPVERLVEQFWPGPLTLLLLKADGLPQRVSATANVAVRLPDHDVARQLIRAVGGALAVSRASIDGKEIPTTAQAVLDLFGGHIAAVLNSKTEHPTDVVSTVAIFDGRNLQVIREGAISEADLKAAIENVR